MGAGTCSKQNSALVGARWHIIVAVSVNSEKSSQRNSLLFQIL